MVVRRAPAWLAGPGAAVGAVPAVRHRPAAPRARVTAACRIRLAAATAIRPVHPPAIQTPLVGSPAITPRRGVPPVLARAASRAPVARAPTRAVPVPIVVGLAAGPTHPRPLGTIGRIAIQTVAPRAAAGPGVR